MDTLRLFSTSLLILSFLGLSSPNLQAQQATPRRLVQQQIDGWNRHDAAEFAAPYADTTTLYTFPNQVLARFRTHREIEAYYTKLFADNPALHCEVANQMQVGSTVVLHEKITGWANRPNSESLVIYQTQNGRITSVHFIRK